MLQPMQISCSITHIPTSAVPTDYVFVLSSDAICKSSQVEIRYTSQHCSNMLRQGTFFNACEIPVSPILKTKTCDSLVLSLAHVKRKISPTSLAANARKAKEMVN